MTLKPLLPEQRAALFSVCLPYIKGTKTFYSCMADLLYCITVNCLKQIFDNNFKKKERKKSRLRAVILYNQNHIKLNMNQMYR